MQTYTFHVNGMHCKACVILTEGELNELPNVHSSKVNFKKLSVEVTGDFGDLSPEAVAADLSKVLEKHGYSLSLTKAVQTVQWSEFTVALPLALVFIAVFVLLQKLGLVNLIGSGKVSYGTAFLIGTIASVSTCMAVVGGLVLSMSASFAKEGDKVKPQLLFHLGRFLSFFVFGGLVGLLGSRFQLGGTGTFVLGLLTAMVLLILGVNLLDVFPRFKNLQPTLPRFLSKHLLQIQAMNHRLTPFLVGTVTFFLPCGFTQSMQIYALGTGSFWMGALTMGFFALGTFPVLALLSFSSLSIQDKSKMGVFFKTAGLVVVFFAFFNLVSTLKIISL